MFIVYRTVFTVAFRVKADRDDFQAEIIATANQIVADLGLKTRVPEGPDLTADTEVGYEWFDSATRDAIWAARVVVGFTDPAESDAFHDALVARVGTKDGKYTYFVDKVGKVGAFNKLQAVVLEAVDRTPPQVDVR